MACHLCYALSLRSMERRTGRQSAYTNRLCFRHLPKLVMTQQAPVIGEEAIARRKYWIEELKKLSGKCGDDYAKLEGELIAEIKVGGYGTSIDHLRLCGDIPESYEHDSSEEKLYSKYTDALLCEAYKMIGLKSLVLKERGDASDVEAFGKDGSFSFVADAKAFRLSRTAKNQKDFKVQAMDGWKYGKPFAMVVCPIYQLPVRSSQIYQQASARNVCIFTYSHLTMLVNYSQAVSTDSAEELLHLVFKTVQAMNPTKDAATYWMGVNQTIFGFDKAILEFWEAEKRASVESIAIAKAVALTFLASERERIMRMSHEQALIELIKINKIESKIVTIQGVEDTRVLEVL